MSREIVYDRDGWDVTLTVRTASTRDRLQRNAVLRTLDTDPAEGEDLELFFYRTYVYANCTVVTTVESRGEKVLASPTVDEFLALPDDLVSQWLDACVEENRHWFPFFTAQAERERSAIESSTTN